MPNCPDCGNELGIFEKGTYCPICDRVFSKLETRGLPGYDRETVTLAYRAFKVMLAAGLLHHGHNKITFEEGGFSIEHKHDQY